MKNKQFMLTLAQQRSMSVLLVPIEPKETLPYELRTTDLTNAEVEALQTSFKNFNAQCSEELKEMNQNRITNIIERGGVEGWETAADLANLSRTFTFTSIEQAQYFVQNVGKFCTQKDHHPEWSSSDGGRTVTVRLTSHFANNKVTLFDFQLAEHMNKQYKITQKWHSRFPLFTEKTWATWKIAIIGFFLLNFTIQLGANWGNLYPSATQRGQKPQAAHYRPLMVAPFNFTSGGLKGNLETDSTLYAAANVDDYAFKQTLFSSRNMF